MVKKQVGQVAADLGNWALQAAQEPETTIIDAGGGGESELLVVDPSRSSVREKRTSTRTRVSKDMQASGARTVNSPSPSIALAGVPTEVPADVITSVQAMCPLASRVDYGVYDAMEELIDQYTLERHIKLSKTDIVRYGLDLMFAQEKDVLDELAGYKPPRGPNVVARVREDQFFALQKFQIDLRRKYHVRAPLSAFVHCAINLALKALRDGSGPLPL